MQPQSTLSTCAREGGEGVGVTRRRDGTGRDVREAQLDVQLEGPRQPTTWAAARSVGCRVAACRLERSERRRDGGGGWTVGTRGIKKC